MNPRLIFAPYGGAAAPALEPTAGSRLREHIDLFLDHRWTVLRWLALALLLGALYVLAGPRVYESNVLVQVEDPDRAGGTLVGESASSALNARTPTAGEAEILKSRQVLGQAIENTRLAIEAGPRQLPVLGPAWARAKAWLPQPDSAAPPAPAPRISVTQLDVPASLEGSRFTLTAGADQSYVLRHPRLAQPIAGRVGETVDASTPRGPVRLRVTAIDGPPGTAFTLVRRSTQATLVQLQRELRVVERGKQSSVIDLSWQHDDPAQLAGLLNEVARLYVRLNIDLKTAQAQRALDFLGSELPRLKAQLDSSEEAYNRYRHQNGTVSLDDEARNALAQNVDLQARLLEATQRRVALTERFTSLEPAVQTLDTQIAALRRGISTVEQRIRRMPQLQQDALRMQRDIKVNTDLYVTVLNSSLQMRLAREGRIGNVRVLDPALQPEKPLYPAPVIAMGIAAVAGLALGLGAVLMRRAWRTDAAGPAEIEAHTGLEVYGMVELSRHQRRLDQAVRRRKPGVHVLAAQHPGDPALEGLRRLRTALRHSVPRGRDNRLMVTSATAGAGKSFVSANLAVLLAAEGQRVLLIDADLHRGSLSACFGLRRRNGLTELLRDRVDERTAVHAQVLPRLDMIGTGAVPSEPALLLSDERFGQLLASVAPHYDTVIIDAPPALLASETGEMARSASTLLMVARAGEQELGDLTQSIKALRQAGVRVQGIVLNAMDLRRRYYGPQAYRYGAYRVRAHAYPALPVHKPSADAAGAAA